MTHVLKQFPLGCTHSYIIALEMFSPYSLCVRCTCQTWIELSLEGHITK